MRLLAGRAVAYRAARASRNRPFLGYCTVQTWREAKVPRGLQTIKDHGVMRPYIREGQARTVLIESTPHLVYTEVQCTLHTPRQIKKLRTNYTHRPDHVFEYYNAHTISQWQAAVV